MDQQALERILSLYFLKPTFVEEYHNTTKVSTQNGVFALKRIPASDRSTSTFLIHLQKLYQSGFSHFVPIYHTNDGRYLVQEGEYMYYLSPWIVKRTRGDDKGELHTQLLKSLGQLHRATLEVKHQDKSAFEDHYQYVNRQWQEERTFLENMIEHSERKFYMSPFELLFCSLYHKALRAHEFATRMLEEWYNNVENRDEVRVVLNHGKVSSEHFLLDDQFNGYFIALEHSYMATPTQDVIQFFRKSLNTYPISGEDRFGWWQAYQKEFPWTKDEIQLLYSYIAYPKRIFDLAHAYHSESSKLSEVEQVGLLQQAFWQMNNVEFLIMKIQEDEYQKEVEEQQKEWAEQNGNG